MDFSQPIKTGNYDTGILQTIRDNQFGLACFLDGVGPISGSPAAGIKRYNASSTLFERWTGTQYVEMPLGYLKSSGGTLTGALLLAGDATAPLHPITKQQFDAGLGTKANTSALAGYAALAGATFTGSIGVNGNISTAGSIGAGGAIYGASASLTGPLIVADGSLTATGSFYLSAANATTPIINFDGGDYFGFDRAGNTLTFNTGGATPLTLAAGGLGTLEALTVATASGGEVNLRLSNPSNLVRFFMRPNGTAGLYDQTRGVVRIDTDLAGNMTVPGLLYGRGGGAGLGQITVQQGGGPSGGADGDWFAIYP